MSVPLARKEWRATGYVGAASAKPWHTVGHLPGMVRNAGWPVLIALAFCLFLSTSLTASELRETPIVKAVQRVRGSVVNIRGEKTIGTPAGQTAAPDAGRRVNGMGTGVLIDSR